MTAWTVKNPVVDIVCIIDRSGSMLHLTHDVIGGFNQFLIEQKEAPGEARLTLTLFDHEYKKLYDRTPLDQVDPLSAETYKPRGWTALLDAVGKTLSEEYNKHGILFIITDGQENHSTEFTKDGVKKLIDDKEKAGWKVTYLGTHADGFDDARAIGVHNFKTWAPTHSGTISVYSNVSNDTKAYRSSVTQDEEKS